MHLVELLRLFQMDHPESSTIKSGVRRKTTLAKVLNLPKGEKLKIECDKSLPANSNASHLSNWCGIIARDCHLFPLDRPTWRGISKESKSRAWEMIAEKFELAEESKHVVLMSLGKHWRDYKCNLKRKHYNGCRTNAERYGRCPEDVDRNQWVALVHYWNSDTRKKISETNKRNRSLLKLAHTSGSKSFARVRFEERNKSSTQQEPTRSDLFVKTHTRKDGLPVNDEAAHVIQRIQQEIENREGSQDSISRDDVISTILGAEKPGRVRGYGLGMTPTMLWGSSSKYGGPSATEFAIIQGKMKEFDEKMEQKDAEMERKDAERDAEMARQAAEMAKLMSIIDTLSAQASNNHITAPQSTDGGNNLGSTRDSDGVCAQT